MEIRTITIAIDFDTFDTYQEILDKFNGFIVMSDYDNMVQRGDEVTINIMSGNNIETLLNVIDTILTDYDYLYPRLLFKEELDARDL
jgi:hypothetical protein